ncbi:MAG: hypothetical protein GF387_01100 [Candidatus Portnoybacteria bacterium]|nr:hypothetical protein [Candidatus Portnoybacteria bacterium]
MIKYIILGFVSKAIASLDDALTRIPVAASLTKKRKGRIAFSVGTLIALALIIVLAILFSSLIQEFPYTRYIAGFLIFLLAIGVHFNLLSREKRGEKITKKKIKKVHKTKISKLITAGFIVAFITLIDDAVVFIPLFLESTKATISAIIGILIAAIIQIILVVYSAKKISKIKHNKEIASIGLIILAILVIIGII